MLIIPLHRAPTRENVPWMTLALILANVFVFAFLQSGDAQVEHRALRYYADNDLARWEFPAYRRWLAAEGTRGDAAERRNAFEMLGQRGDLDGQTRVLNTDRGFLDALHDDRAVAPTEPGYADWRERREAFDRIWESGFSDRWMMRFSEFSASRMVGAMFLHGGIGHLLGNMLFLALLGLLVEGALGPWLFLSVYLIGGLGAQCVSLAFRWGETGTALGASGAIAALMGAYCVLWGLRRVRFFWWFFVAFDYVKAPALVLLPFWLGWELFNLRWNAAERVGFDAHAGGILCGALLAFGVRALHWERRDFLDEDERHDAALVARADYDRALEHLGRLELPAARALLEPLAARAPEDFAIRAALYRVARYEPRMPRLDAAARAVATLRVRGAPELREQKAIVDDYLKARAGDAKLDAATLVALARIWPTVGASADAARVLALVATRDPATPDLASACLDVARAARERGEHAVARELLERVATRHAASPEAAKAKLLLGDLP